MQQQCLKGWTDADRALALFDWRFWARPNQLPPPDPWVIWLMMAGRGFGKTRSGAEWVRERVEAGAGSIALVAKTPADARDVMIEGKPDAPGLLGVFPPWQKPSYEPSKRRVTFHTGAIATAYSGAEPDQLRGPNHDTAWADEPASWKYPSETWDNLMLGLRLGDDPRAIATTTPKPIKLMRDLVNRARQQRGVVLTTGSTYDNRANLAEPFFQEIVGRYEGTTLGQQEIYASLLEEMPGALWTRATIEANRLPEAPPLRRIVVAVDPAASMTEESAETGVIIAGLAANGHAYVLGDRSGRVSPDTWGKRAVEAYREYRADRILGEHNNGGDMVAHTIRTVDPRASYGKVWASKGKYTRAEPIAALYEQGKVHHVGVFPALEDQLCTWVPGEVSPDRMDALVWALSDLMLGAGVGAAQEVPQSLERVSPWR